jgi:ABC-type multidrug transport system ATPase subunit/ABC-type multidrug transport system permease subunit
MSEQPLSTLNSNVEHEDLEPLIPEGRVPVTLSWENVSYSIKVSSGLPWNRVHKQKTLLNGVSGVVKPGQLLAIMGSTGAGKSTLLDVLVGYKNTGTLNGDIRINGQPRNHLFKRMAGYVTQDDCLMETQTVRETLKFCADIKLPKSLSQRERDLRVQNVIDELRLTKVGDSFVGSQFQRGISGGEKKRVSIGCELITDPGLLFLDEPTTGLDAYNSLVIMELLNSLAKSGRTIICTIHQPRSSIFELFDQLLLLSQGNVVYFGPANQAVPYFAAVSLHCPQFTNPADFFIDMVIENERIRDGLIQTQEDAPNLVEYYLKSSEYRITTERIRETEKEMSHVSMDLQARVASAYPSEFATPLWRQFLLIAERSIRNIRRNPIVTYLQLFNNFFMALLVGSIFFHLGMNFKGIQDRQGSLFFILTNQAFASLASMNLFLNERNLFNRERASGTYSVLAYYLSKCTVEGVFQLGFPIVYTFVVFWMVGLDSSGFFCFLMDMLVTSAVASSLYVAIGAASPNQPVATIISPIVTVIYLLFGGFYLNQRSFPVYYIWAKYISFFRYSFEILCRSQFEGQNFIFNATTNTSGAEVLYELDMQDVSYTTNFLVLIAMIFIYRILAFLFLTYLYKEKR